MSDVDVGVNGLQGLKDLEDSLRGLAKSAQSTTAPVDRAAYVEDLADAALANLLADLDKRLSK